MSATSLFKIEHWHKNPEKNPTESQQIRKEIDQFSLSLFSTFHLKFSVTNANPHLYNVVQLFSF